MSPQRNASSEASPDWVERDAEAKALERDLRDTVERLERASDQRARLLRHLVKAEMEERERIASGIHDDSIQVMTSASMALDLLLSRWDSGPSREVALRARHLVRDSISRLRSLVFELKPVELDKEGLATALRLVLERATSEGDFTYEMNDRLPREIPGPMRYLFYRILQEAIANIRKHADASWVVVTLSEQDGGVFAHVRDDGKGFDPLSTDGSLSTDDDKHFGLTDMQQRAEVAGGWCRVVSGMGLGTTVEVWIPLTDDPEQQTA